MTAQVAGHKHVRVRGRRVRKSRHLIMTEMNGVLSLQGSMDFEGFKKGRSNAQKGAFKRDPSRLHCEAVSVGKKTRR